MFMSSPLPAAAPNPTRTQRRLAVLKQWAEAGVALARTAVETVTQGTGLSLARGALALARIFQAVRLALALHARLSDPESPAFRPAPAKSVAPRTAERTAERDAPDETPTEDPAPKRPPVEDPTRLSSLLASDDAILRRPLAEIVKVICKALGVTPEWSLWSDPPQAPAGPAAAPPSGPGLAVRVRQQASSILDRVQRKPAIWTPPSGPAPGVGRLLTRLRSSCAPLALDPLAALASGRIRLPAIG
jgi:hypothetical protein